MIGSGRGRGARCGWVRNLLEWAGAPTFVVERGLLRGDKEPSGLEPDGEARGRRQMPWESGGWGEGRGYAEVF